MGEIIFIFVQKRWTKEMAEESNKVWRGEEDHESYFIWI